MTSGATTDRFQQLFDRVQELQDRLDGCGDAATRELAEELVAAVVQLYGGGLERIVEVLAQTDNAGTIATGLTDDPLVSTLLLIHDLHPVPLRDRVQAALDSVRPYMESHGGNVELLSLADGVARIHLQGSCSDCSASSVTLELAIKQALEEAAPDLLGLEVEGVEPTVTGAPLPMTSLGAELPLAAGPAWHELETVADLAAGQLRGVIVDGHTLVVANVEGTLLAYRDACAACGASLTGGTLDGGALACPACERSFFLPRAGRSLDDERLQLEPVPLLREHGCVKVALAT